MSKVKMITAGLVLVAFLVTGCSTQGTTPVKDAVPQATELKVYKGVGQTQIFRQRVDKETKEKLYSLNYVVSSALFDKDGKIIDVYFDILELTPPDAKHTVGVFSGWPKDEAGEKAVAKEIADWKTKREKGDAAYGMNWSEQADFYASFFKGKTVAEVEAWYAKNTSDKNGKPLTAEMTDPADAAKYGKLSDAEKKALADVTSGASISLNDPHGDFIGALKEAFAAKKEVALK